MGVRNVLVVVICTFFICAVKPEENLNFPKQSCELDLAQLLLLPSDSMQFQALKQDLLKYLEERLESNDYPKYSLNTFATDAKRSIANLAKNGQLPTFQRQDGAHDKRSIASLARNGELHSKRELNGLLNELYEKRNLASLARSYNLPSGKRIPSFGEYDDFDYDKRNLQSIVRNSGKRYYDEDPSYFYDEIKRNIASIARENSRFLGKRNVAALLRQDSYLNDAKSDDSGIANKKNSEEIISENEEKRNIASLKAQMKGARTKRQADYSWINEEYPVPVYQNNGVYDYEEMIKALTGQYPETEKRFLGSVARTGWFRPVSGQPAGRFQEQDGSPIAKRHIGALAKLGWLPALRSARRFHRSGRSAVADYAVEDDRFLIPEPHSADGSSKNNAQI